MDAATLTRDLGGKWLRRYGIAACPVCQPDPLSLSGPNMIDMIGSAILQTALTDFAPDGIVLHPSDWMRMRMLKDTDGKYLLGDPQSQITPQLFGLPVVATQAMTVDKFLVGSFASAGTLYDRWQPRVEVGYENDDFTKNLVTVLAEDPPPRKSIFHVQTYARDTGKRACRSSIPLIRAAIQSQFSSIAQ